jgi:CBS domain-containing protein
MNEHLTDVIDFCRQIPPFDTLNGSALNELANHIIIGYCRMNDALPLNNAPESALYIVRKGALGYFEQQQLVGKYGEGDVCTVFYAPTRSTLSVICQEDSLLYLIDGAWFSQFCQQHSTIANYFSLTAEQRLHQLKKQQPSSQEILLTKTLAELCHQQVISISADTSIEQAAKIMTLHKVSCLPVIEQQTLCGIVTDRDMRSRCIAEGKSPKDSVGSIMSTKLLCLQHDETAHDALLLMMQRHIHHVPVMKNKQLFGIISATDLMNQQAETAASLISYIRKCQQLDDYRQFSQLLGQWQSRVLNNHLNAHHFGLSMSAICKALTHRLIEQAIDKLGQPPVPFAWLGAGSQARGEILLNSDQDNAMILHDDVKPEHQAYFADLAQYVCDGLNFSGFIYCPGYIMATNDQWRQTQSVWRKYFNQWIHKPDGKSLLNASVFFDLQTVYGDPSLLADVRADMLQQTQKNTLFLAHLSQNVNRQKPPLGFFRDFVLISSGEHKSMLDIKKVGTSVIVDLARIYALATGDESLSTLERLQNAAGSSVLSRSAAKSLIDSFEFLSELRLTHQFQQMQQGKKIDNFISPKQLSKVEREHLKAVFKAIKLMQEARPAVYG